MDKLNKQTCVDRLKVLADGTRFSVIEALMAGPLKTIRPMRNFCSSTLKENKARAYLIETLLNWTPSYLMTLV